MAIATNPDTGETVFLSDAGKWEPAKTAVNPQTKEMVAFDGKDWAPVPVKSKGVMDYVNDAAHSIANGAMLGWADEAKAKIEELKGNGDYETNLKNLREHFEKIPAGIRIPGEVAGAVGSTILAAPAAAAAVPTALAKVALKVPAVLRYAGLGAAEGAVQGAGDAEPGHRAEGAGSGALVGGAVGAAAPVVVSGVAKVANAVRNAVSPEANVAADLGRAITRDGDTPASIAARAVGLEAERPGATMLADAGGENVRGLVERVAQTPGAGRTQVVPALTDRQQQQAGRIGRDLRDLTDTRRTAMQAVDETMTQRKDAAKPLYDAAMKFDVSTAPEVVDAFSKAISTGWGKSIVQSPEFRKTLQTEYGITGTPGKEVMMNVIDAWKKQADDIVGEAVRSGNGNKARVISKMRDDVIGAVDKANPAYAQARNAWAGPSKYLDSIEDGRNILSSKVGAEELAGKVGAMSAAEQEAYRIGAVSSIIGKMGADPAKLGDMTKYLRSPEVRAKIAAIMPTPEAAEKWAKRLDFEVSASELTGRSLGNSATARRLAERQDAESLVGDLVMDAIGGGGVASLWHRVVMAGPKWAKDTLRSKADAKLADTLTTNKSAAELQAILDRAQGTLGKVSGTTNALAVAGGNAVAN